MIFDCLVLGGCYGCFVTLWFGGFSVGVLS